MCVISCIGISYLEPILDLTWKLIKIKSVGKSKVKIASRENSYASLIIVGIVSLIESLSNNLKYRKRATSRSDRRILNFLRNNYEIESDFLEDLNELFTVRNAIIHNHIWKIDYEYDDNYNEINIEKELLDGYGDTAYRQIVDSEAKVTSKLRLRIIPTRVSKREVKVAFNILKKFSEFLDNQQLPFISNDEYCFPKKQRKFEDVVSIINGKL